MNKWIPKGLLLFVTGILLLASSWSQNISYLTTNNGLNNGAVNDIVQDSTGQIWLATWDGISRYDGYTLNNYRPQRGKCLNSLCIPKIISGPSLIWGSAGTTGTETGSKG